MKGSFSYSVYQDMLKLAEPRDYPAKAFMGIDIVPNSAFPMRVRCTTCDGTGEGEESTYCPKCKGQGENRYDGMMRSGRQTILLTGPLPKKFAPYFPRGVVAAPPISRGLA